MSEHAFKPSVTFKPGDRVYDHTHKKTATVLDNYGDALNGDGGDIRLDTDGNQPIFTYDENYERDGYNLEKLKPRVKRSNEYTPNDYDPAQAKTDAEKAEAIIRWQALTEEHAARTKFPIKTTNI